MAEQVEQQVGKGKEYPQVNNQNLSLFEHRFIGGSESVNKEMFDSNRLRDDALKGNLSSDYFTPVSVLKGEKLLTNVVEERRGKYLRGALAFLGEPGIDLFVEGYETVVELPEVSPSTGIHEPKWRLFLLKDGKEVVREDLLNKLKPIGEVGKLLDWELKPDGIYLSYVAKKP